jgi:hypothetical protein
MFSICINNLDGGLQPRATENKDKYENQNAGSKKLNPPNHLKL